MLSEKLIHFYQTLQPPKNLPKGINPGRYGAGITGVNFTAPRQLKENCRIDHHLGLTSELSAEFIYDMIGEYGGVKKFYSNWFIGSVCPLGFTASPNPSEGGAYGKNVNYYDDKELLNAVTPFIIDCINKQVAIGFKTEKCLCIGGEKNFKFLSSLNNEYRWFKE